MLPQDPLSSQVLTGCLDPENQLHADGVWLPNRLCSHWETEQNFPTSRKREGGGPLEPEDQLPRHQPFSN